MIGQVLIAIWVLCWSLALIIWPRAFAVFFGEIIQAVCPLHKRTAATTSVEDSLMLQEEAEQHRWLIRLQWYPETLWFGIQQFRIIGTVFTAVSIGLLLSAFGII